MQGQANATLFQTLPDDLLQRFGQSGQCRNYADQQLISSRGDRSRALCIIETGGVRASNIGLDGRRVETALLEPGDCFGEFTLFAGSPRFFDFHAQGSTRLRSVSKAEFDRLMQDSAILRDGVLEMLTRRLLTAVEVIEDMRRLPLPTQLAKLIWLRAQPDEHGQLRYVITQSELADILGVSRVAVGHALNRLKRDNLIRTAYGCIEVCDAQNLHAWLGQRAQLLEL